MRVESRGRDSRREQSKIDAVVPQLQFDYGYMGDGGPLQSACFFVGTDTSSGATHATIVPDSRWLQVDGHALTLSQQQPCGCVTWGMNAFCPYETKKEFFSCCCTKWHENVVLKDKTGKFYEKCH